MTEAADLAPSPATRQQWHHRRRRQRLTAGGRLAAPVIAVVVLEAVLADARGSVARRGAAAVRPALWIVAVTVPLGLLALAAGAAALRSRDQRRRLAPGQRYAGYAVLHIDTTAITVGRGPTWAIGELLVTADHQGLSLQWSPGRSARDHGIAPVPMRAVDLTRTELELTRHHFGYARFGTEATGPVDFGVLDLARLVDALTLESAAH